MCPRVANGAQVFLVGLILQLVSFCIFIGVFAAFLLRLRSHAPLTWSAPRWKVLLAAMVLSFVGILVRSVYRVVELSQGFAGALATTESLFYALDTLPLFVAIAVYVPFWPGRFIPSADARLVLANGEYVDEAEKRPAPSEDSSARAA